MKKMFTLAVLMTIAITAAAMSPRHAMDEARRMTDRMAVELSLSRHQYDQVLHINTDYMRSVGTRDEGRARTHRQHQLERVLTVEQMRRFTHHGMAPQHPDTWRHPAPQPAPQPRPNRHHGSRNH